MGNILDSILHKEYEQLTVKNLFILDKYKKVFGLDKEFTQLLKKYSLNKKDETLIDELDKEIKIEVIEELQKKLLPRTNILENLSSNDLNHEGIDSNFKNRFINGLSELSNFQICKFIDRIGYYIKKKKLNFFGKTPNNVGAYHQINKVISDSMGLSLVFDIFGKNLSNNYLHLDIEKFNKEGFIKCLNEYCIRYSYILEIMCKVFSSFNDDELEGKKVAFAINKGIKFYLQIIKEDSNKNVISGEPSTNYYGDDLEEDDDE